MLPFVIAHASRIKPTIANGWFEWRRNPGVQWLGRLHIVMPIKQDGRPAWHIEPFSQHHWPSGCRQYACLYSHTLHNIRDVGRNLADSLSMGADAWTTHVIDQAIKELLAMSIDVSEYIGQIWAGEIGRASCRERV